MKPHPGIGFQIGDQVFDRETSRSDQGGPNFTGDGFRWDGMGGGGRGFVVGLVLESERNGGSIVPFELVEGSGSLLEGDGLGD